MVAIDQPMGSDLGTACITGNSEYTATNLIIPKYVSDISGKHYKIVEIGDGSFNGDYGLTGSLTLPNTLTTIGKFAFGRDETIHGGLIIPDSVTIIGEYAFNSCSNLTALTLSNNVESIGEYAFFNCSGIGGNLTLPISLVSVGSYCFSGMSLTNISAQYTSSPTWIGSDIFFTYHSPSGTVSNNGVGYTSTQFLTYLKTKGLPTGWTT